MKEVPINIDGWNIVRKTTPLEKQPVGEVIFYHMYDPNGKWYGSRLSLDSCYMHILGIKTKEEK
jgi:hypothetical protein